MTTLLANGGSEKATINRHRVHHQPFLGEKKKKNPGWNVNATNPSSGAYGLASGAARAVKMASHGADLAVELLQTQIRKWSGDYCKGRLRLRAGAPYNFWAGDSTGTKPQNAVFPATIQGGSIQQRMNTTLFVAANKGRH